MTEAAAFAVPIPVHSREHAVRVHPQIAPAVRKRVHPVESFALHPVLQLARLIAGVGAALEHGDHHDFHFHRRLRRCERRGQHEEARRPDHAGESFVRNSEHRSPSSMKSRSVHEAGFLQHVLRGDIIRIGHADEGRAPQHLVSGAEAGARDLGGQTAAPERCAERVSDFDFVDRVDQQVPQHGGADGRTATALAEDPESKPVVVPVFQVAGEIVHGLRVVPNAADVAHHVGIHVQAPQILEVIGRETLGLKARREERVRKGDGGRSNQGVLAIV